MITRFSHFGHAVKSIDEVLPIYQKLWNLQPATRSSFPEDATANALIPVGQNYIELLQPTSTQGILGKFIHERGEGMYHLSWVVEDVEKAVQALRAKGAQAAEAPPQTNLPYKRGWIHPRSTKGLLIELVEERLMAHLGHQPRPGPSGSVIALTHVHHVVKSLDEALAMYDRLWGIQPIKRTSTPRQGVNNAIVRIGRTNYIELLEPADPQGLIAKHIEKRGEGLRSLCLTVADYPKAIQELRAKGIEVAEMPTDSGNFPVRSAWIGPKYTRGLMVELCEHQELLRFMDPGRKDA